VIFLVPPALGALVILHPPNPSVLLVLVLVGICYRLVSRDVCELFIVVIHIAKGGHVDLTIR
jgi:hypothetical protein